MINVLDVFDAFNLIDRVEGGISRLLGADWRGARNRGGAVGVAGELGRSLLGANEWTFRAPRLQSWSGTDMERFLRRYGIAIWGRRVTSEHYIFSVKERQANWAEYLLMRRGITLDGPLYNSQNAVYAQQHAPGDQPPAWAERVAAPKTGADRMLDLLP